MWEKNIIVGKKIQCGDKSTMWGKKQILWKKIKKCGKKSMPLIILDIHIKLYYKF